MNWVLNTIAYGDLMAQESFGQLDMIDSVKGLGFDYIELRSEYFDGSDQELVDLKAANQKAGLTVFLSVPAPLFEEGLLNPELENYFELAQAVGAIQLKVNLGAYNPETVVADMTLVNKLIDRFSISLTLENDITKATGASDYFKAFLQDNGNDKVGMCFDVGNFLYFDEDPVTEVKNVLPLVHYVHLKQVEQATNTSLAGLSVGDVDFVAVLKEIDPAIPIAIECQYKASDIAEVEGQIKNDIENILSGLN
ncbi:sugar phosphate isomerase/epimerase family protein [Aerococcus viridans]|uniref:Sugar phosphate isomerase/epimerase n=1 Tax=Aerococcus viridans TaxID=1377 RepID=A0A2J9PNZ5_9LACT|nr:sugar phosphate isomerase/epimerase [Aerococcus viridans]MCT1797336.1 sugar phosphate isomerase/epimerase [Aerococcus viridans]PNL92037.1 sugar phosphate isomerase/epimerase [Aerococcus viridans]